MSRRSHIKRAKVLRHRRMAYIFYLDSVNLWSRCKWPKHRPGLVFIKEIKTAQSLRGYYHR